MHGQEPSADVARAMAQCDVIFCLTKMSMAHTQARKAATDAGARYLSLPDYSTEVLSRQAMAADFVALTEISRYIAGIFTAASVLTMRSPAGTDLACRVDGRVANMAPGWCDGPGSLASPPDSETNIAIVEDSSHGIFVVDGSIPCREFGVLKSPITLTVAGGRVVAIAGEGAVRLNDVFDRLGDPRTRVLAEFGLGLNPKAELTGSMLEDEGCLGTAHIGIGANGTIGGTNNVPFHLDCIIKAPSIEADGRLVVDRGRIVHTGKP